MDSCHTFLRPEHTEPNPTDFVGAHEHNPQSVIRNRDKQRERDQTDGENRPSPLALRLRPAGVDRDSQTQEIDLTNQGKFTGAFGSPFNLRQRQLFYKADVQDGNREGLLLAGSCLLAQRLALALSSP